MQTLISAFEDHHSAERAIQNLVQAGFARDNIHLHEHAFDEKGDFAEKRERGVFSSLGHFFVSVFGQDAPEREAGHFSEAARRGNAVLVTTVSNEEEAERAAAILDAAGAIDIDERAEQWRASGWTGYTDSPAPPTGVQMLVGPPKRRGVRVWKRAGDNNQH